MPKRSSDGKDKENRNEKHEIEVNYLNLLSTDLIRKILLPLHVKVIVTCKAVCRELYNLLSSPEFEHHYKVVNTPFTTLLVSHCRPGIDRDVLSFVEIFEDGHDYRCIQTTFEPKIPRRWPEQSTKLIDSCNGLLCLLQSNNKRSDDDVTEVIYIYNPTSGASISLPVRTYSKNNNGRVVVAYRFGFCPSTNNFKVLRVATIYGRSENQCISIFTVGVDQQWRRLKYHDDFRFCPIPNSHTTVVLNGVVCWLLSNKSIGVFDMGKETIGHIAFPPLVVVVNCRLKLRVSNSRLCLLDFSIPSRYTLWTMEVYGDANSWTKIVILGTCLPSSNRPFWLYPIAMLRNRNIIYQPSCSKGLVSYSPKQKECILLDAPAGKEGIVTHISEFAQLGFSPKEGLPRELVMMMKYRDDQGRKKKIEDA